jgi:hypothetical protein
VWASREYESREAHELARVSDVSGRPGDLADPSNPSPAAAVSRLTVRTSSLSLPRSHLAVRA